MREYSKSLELHQRACKVLAGGVSSEFRKFIQPHPLFYSHAEGSRIWDVDGNEYLDFTLSQGPLILGHSHPRVLTRVAEISEEGQLFAGQHIAELELAERLQRLIPCAELIRFSLSGSEADHAALRLARAVTGRKKFLRFEGHYHGWFDNVSFSVASPNLEALGDREAPHSVPWSEGLPEHASEESIVLPWNDLALVERTLAKRHKEIAAIITEPVMCNSGCIAPEPGFLEGLREICDRYGCLLIFDEVITGFRLGLSGAQGYFGITPDLAVFGKAMASGYPISVLAGKREFMRLIAEGKVIHAGTMNAGSPSVAAALATLDELEIENPYERLFSFGEKLMHGLREAGRETGHSLYVQGMGPMFHVGFTTASESFSKATDYRGAFAYDKSKYAKFVWGMQERGIRLIGRGLWYVSAVHTDAEIETAISAARGALREMVVR